MRFLHRFQTPLLILALLALSSACFAANIGEAKRDIADGCAVSFQGLSVTAVFPGSVYVEESNRCAGIRVDTDETLEEGDVVDVEGIIETDLADERHVDAYPGYPKAAPAGGKLTLQPLGLATRALIGGDAGFQHGIPGDRNLNTIGLLVRVCGAVSVFDDPDNPQGWFKIGGPAGPEVKVIVPSGVTIANMDSGNVVVTGICSVEKVDGVMVRVIKVPKKNDWAQNRLEKMTLDEKIGQLFQVRVQGDVFNESMRQLVQDKHVGGIVYFQSGYNNLDDPVRSAQLSNDLQTSAMGTSGTGIPLLISMDQEGGRVTRITGGCDFPGNMGIGASRSTDLAYLTGSVLGSEIKAVGGNMDLAPDLDVNNNPANPVIGIRSFAEQPGLVSDMGIAYTSGLHSAGIIATGKHFPGHGDTAVDSHSGLPVVTYDFATLDTVHGKPFRDAIANGLDCIMTAHIVVTCLDPNHPSTLSPQVVDGYLRGNLGFDGVVMTDSMGMAGITKGYTTAQATTLAIKAGCDLLSLPPDLNGAIAALKSAVTSGDIPESRIDQSVLRILRLKRRNGIIANPFVDASAAGTIVGSASHRASELSAARAAMTLVQNTGNILPLSLTPSQKVLLVVVQSSDTTTDAATRFDRIMDTKHSNVQTIPIGHDPSPDTQTTVKNAAAGAYVTIVATSRANYVSTDPNNPQSNVSQAALINALIEAGRRVIVVGTREPYEFGIFPGVNAYLAAYNYRNCGFQAAADVIFGDYHPIGLLPVTIPGQYNFGWGLGF